MSLSGGGGQYLSHCQHPRVAESNPAGGYWGVVSYIMCISRVRTYMAVCMRQAPGMLAGGALWCAPMVGPQRIPTAAELQNVSALLCRATPASAVTLHRPICTGFLKQLGILLFWSCQVSHRCRGRSSEMRGGEPICAIHLWFGLCQLNLGVLAGNPFRHGWQKMTF